MVRGVIYNQMGLTQEAHGALVQAASLLPDSAEAQHHLATVASKLGQSVEAESCYLKAIKLKPDSAEYHFNLGNLYFHLNRMGEAQACYRRAVQQKPESHWAHYNLANALRELHAFPEAALSFQAALQVNPEFAEGHANLGAVLRSMGQLEAAKVSCEHALQINPNLPEAYTTLGAISLELGQSVAAEACYRHRALLTPESPQAHSDLGAALESLGRVDEALACYRKAAQMGFHKAKIKAALLLPAIIGTRAEMLASRLNYEQQVDELISSAEIFEDPLFGGGATSFYLAYHGLNDKALQMKVASYYGQSFPQLNYTSPHCNKSDSGIKKKKKIGFISRYCTKHSVSLCFSKIIEIISLKPQFEVTLISSLPIDMAIYSGFSGGAVLLPND
jgi:tetratricopeptide (TPR) repeat protein